MACIPSDKTADISKMTYYAKPYRGITSIIANLSKSLEKLYEVVDRPYKTIIRPKLGMRFDTAP